MGYPLHGQDISLDVTPVQARLGWAVGWSKPAFWGKDALVAEKAAGAGSPCAAWSPRVAASPCPQMSVKVTRDLPIGFVTSGTFSPTLRKGVALALINSQIQLGAEVLVDVRGREETFVVTRPPFVETDVRETGPTSTAPHERTTMTNSPEPAFGAPAPAGPARRGGGSSSTTTAASPRPSARSPTRRDAEAGWARPTPTSPRTA